MSIYLYVKTHNKTGLKYLGKTEKDPHKYKGSGDIWIPHLKKHGYEVTTEIIVECKTNEEIKYWGLYYSDLWDVVNARDENGKKIWANLKPESGDGGAQSNESIQKGLETKKKNGTLNTNTSERIQKGLETKKKNGTYGKITCTPESIQKGLETKKKNGTMNTNTRESCEKRKNTMIANGTTTNTPKSIQKGLETKKKNRTLTRTKEMIEKMIDTRSKNGKLNTRTPENIEKQKRTILESGNNNFIQNNPNKKKQECPHCFKLVGAGNYSRWHVDNCRTKKT